MFVTLEKRKEKGEIQSWEDRTRYQVDGSDKVVVGDTTERVAEARIVCRVPKEQRDDARDTICVRGERSFFGECSIDRDGRGAERGQSSLAPWYARSGTRKMWNLHGLRGVETSWQRVPRAHQSGYGVRRRGPAKKTVRWRSESRQQHRPQELRQLRRARNRLQGLRQPRRSETNR